MMEQKELCQWLRNYSSGICSPSLEAADEIERLQAAWDCSFKQALENGAAALRAESAKKWISCEDRLPEIDGRYLVYTNDIVTSWVDPLTFEQGFWCDENGEWPCIVTHWMPIPKEPQDV